mgnify:CR=1 FL=1
MKKFETRLSSLNIVDYIYTHDIVFLNSITEEKQKLYLDFLGEISDINFERNYYGKDAELYKHLLLCSIEIIISTRQEYTDGEASLDTNDYSAIFLEKILTANDNYSIQKDNYFFNNSGYKDLAQQVVNNTFELASSACIKNEVFSEIFKTYFEINQEKSFTLRELFS